MSAPITHFLPRLRFRRPPTNGLNTDLEGKDWEIQVVTAGTVAARPYGQTGDLQEYVLEVAFPREPEMFRREGVL